MSRIIAASFIVCSLVLRAAGPATAVTIDWATIGNPGNPSDPLVAIDFTSGYGSVDHTYKIDTYDITSTQFSEFLNATDPAALNTLRLYSSFMDSSEGCGIAVDFGSPAGSHYYVRPGDENLPVNNVNWFTAVRFANWMNNGQGNGDTESGAYTLLHVGSPVPTPIPSNSLTITRNPGATIFLPSENEWYKAAYYNPAMTSYFLYPTSNNSPPTAASPTSAPNSANYHDAVVGLTNVGAYSGASSPYGLFDMGGNVYNWNDSLINVEVVGPSRGSRGGSFASSAEVLAASWRGTQGPKEGSSTNGFRLASVPEPNSLALAAVAFIGLIACGWRRRR